MGAGLGEATLGWDGPPRSLHVLCGSQAPSPLWTGSAAAGFPVLLPANHPSSLFLIFPSSLHPSSPSHIQGTSPWYPQCPLPLRFLCTSCPGRSLDRHLAQLPPGLVVLPYRFWQRKHTHPVSGKPPGTCLWAQEAFISPETRQQAVGVQRPCPPRQAPPGDLSPARHKLPSFLPFSL